MSVKIRVKCMLCLIASANLTFFYSSCDKHLKQEKDCDFIERDDGIEQWELCSHRKTLIRARGGQGIERYSKSSRRIYRITLESYFSLKTWQPV